MAGDISAQIARMKAQGMGNDDIARQLLFQGYTNADIFEAMSQADTAAASENPVRNMDFGLPQPPSQFNQPPQQPRQQESRAEIDSDKIAEIAESIIEEKWSDLVDHVNRIIEWKSSIELKLASMEEQLKSMKSDFDILHKSILGKISDSDSVMREVSVDIKALEQVFKKILPGFVENVNELSKITQSLRRK